MSRPKQQIKYLTLPAGVVATFVASVVTGRPQPYYVVTVSGGALTVPAIYGTFTARRRARRAVANVMAQLGLRSWVLWYNRKIGEWFYELAAVPIV